MAYAAGSDRKINTPDNLRCISRLIDEHSRTLSFRRVRIRVREPV